MVEKKERPISPHLQIYRWQITNTLSILHRLTGIGLCFTLVSLVVWLGCLAYGVVAYEIFMGLFKSVLGQIGLLLSLFAFFYHLGNGVRHLAWDAGYGFTIKQTTVTGWLVVFFAVLSTLFTWIAIC